MNICNRYKLTPNLNMLMDSDAQQIYGRYTQQILREMAVVNAKLMSDVVGGVKMGDRKKTHGTDRHSFTPTDARIMNNPNSSYLNKLPSLIGANIGYDFVVIVNDLEDLPHNIPPTPGAITVVVDPTPFYSKDDDNTVWNRNMSLTPHIICHKVGHALSDDRSPFSEKVTLEVVVPLLQYKLEAAKTSKTLSKEAREEMIEYIQQWIDMFREEKFQQSLDGCPYAPCELGKFKTARESLDESMGDINTYGLEPGEFFNEVVARYMITGRIDFNPWPDAQRANKMANYLKSKIHEMLDMCVGRVIGQFEWKL